MFKIINEDNFAQLVQAHELIQTGDFNGAKTIFDELGIKKPLGQKGGLNQQFKHR